MNAIKKIIAWVIVSLLCLVVLLVLGALLVLQPGVGIFILSYFAVLCAIAWAFNEVSG